MPELDSHVPMAGNELGRTGLKQVGGWIYEEFLPNLQGDRGIKVYQEMRENSAVIGAMMFAIESLLRSVEWNVVPVSEDDADLEAAEFLESCRHDMSHTWEDFISEVLTMLTFGWSYFEVVYKRREGQDGRHPSREDDRRVGWRKFAPRSQDSLYRWRFDQFGGIEGMFQQPFYSGSSEFSDGQEIRFLPINRCLLFRTTSVKNNPEGRSVLRSAYRSWYMAKRLEEIESIGAERDLAGMPVMWVPMEILADDKTAAAQSTYNTLRDIVTRVKRDQQEGMMLPLVYDENGRELYRFELLSTGGRRQFDTGSIIQRYHQQMAMTVIADFILLGHENVGSFALSSDKTELFAVALGAWLDAIEEVINRHAVPRLFELNAFSLSELPRIEHGDIEKPDLQALGAYIQQLAAAGFDMTGDLLVENFLRHAADLPPVDEEARAQQQQEAQQQQLDQQQMMLPPGPSPDDAFDAMFERPPPDLQRRFAATPPGDPAAATAGAGAPADSNNPAQRPSPPNGAAR